MKNNNNKISVDQIIELISKVIQEENINESTSMENCLNWDSLSHASIIAIISEEFNIEITPVLFSNLISVKEIYNFLNK